jgi:hypothetical protein
LTRFAAIAVWGRIKVWEDIFRRLVAKCSRKASLGILRHTEIRGGLVSFSKDTLHPVKVMTLVCRLVSSNSKDIRRIHRAE